jgi:hypothetical protein
LALVGQDASVWSDVVRLLLSYLPPSLAAAQQASDVLRKCAPPLSAATATAFAPERCLSCRSVPPEARRLLPAAPVRPVWRNTQCRAMQCLGTSWRIGTANRMGARRALRVFITTAETVVKTLSKIMLQARLSKTPNGRARRRGCVG